MRLSRAAEVVVVALLALGAGAVAAQTQGSVDDHLTRARAASGQDFDALYGVTCDLVKPPAGAAPAAPAAASGPPARATWHAEPAKVFDNVYFVGQSEYSAWAVTTSAGIILMDAIFDYSVEDEVVNGLRRSDSTRRRSSTWSSATRMAIMSAARGFCRSAARAS